MSFHLEATRIFLHGTTFWHPERGDSDHFQAVRCCDTRWIPASRFCCCADGVFWQGHCPSYLLRYWISSYLIQYVILVLQGGDCGDNGYGDGESGRGSQARSRRCAQA